jgi:dynein heavy chain, axonemal
LEEVQVLKDVLGAISKVKVQSPEMELRYHDLSDRFRTRLHTCKPEHKAELEQEHQQSVQLHAKWDSLCDEAAQILASLEDIKSDFAEVTGQQANEFKRKVAEFYETFKASGPGRGNVQLAAGLAQIKKVDSELTGMLQRRDELVLAQKLFSMDITPYPELTNVRNPAHCLGSRWPDGKISKVLSLICNVRLSGFLLMQVVINHSKVQFLG